MTESRGDFRFALAIFEKQKMAANQIDGWIHTHPGEISIESLSIQFDIEKDYCRRMVESNPDIITTINTNDNVGHQKVYTSIAILLPKTTSDTPIHSQIDNTNKVKKVGIDARADFYELIRIRSLNLHQGKRRHFFGSHYPKLKSN
jgi:hypothetical protein